MAYPKESYLIRITSNVIKKTMHSLKGKKMNVVNKYKVRNSVKSIDLSTRNKPLRDVKEYLIQFLNLIRKFQILFISMISVMRSILHALGILQASSVIEGDNS